jgi:GH24 family phage-related lysozyme (muramidase)
MTATNQRGIREMKRLFDIIRSIKGSGLTLAEVERINAQLEASDAPDPQSTEDWEELAVPLIKQFEGFAKDIGGGQVKAYPDPGTGGAPWTIGWGSTGPDIGPSTVWTRAKAEERFRAHIREFSDQVRKHLDGARATEAQFAAMVSLAYNIGHGAFGNSTLLKRHKAGNYDAAAREFLRWNRAGGRVMPGLARRREAEAGLYRASS